MFLSLGRNCFSIHWKSKGQAWRGPPYSTPCNPHTAVIHDFLLLAPPRAPQLKRTRRSSYSLFLWDTPYDSHPQGITESKRSQRQRVRASADTHQAFLFIRPFVNYLPEQRQSRRESLQRLRWFPSRPSSLTVNYLPPPRTPTWSAHFAIYINSTFWPRQNDNWETIPKNPSASSHVTTSPKNSG